MSKQRMHTPLERRKNQEIEQQPVANLSIVPESVYDVLESDGQSLDSKTRAFMEPRFGHDFSQILLYSMQPAISQTHLAVNQPGDIYELEADRIAEQVIGMMGQGSALRYNEEQQSTETPTYSATNVSSVPSIVQATLGSGGGQPLDTATRAFMEPRFGRDFRNVRVHTDERAAESASAINAQAYTVGNDVIFGREQYAPESGEGKKLLAHELTHVVQQGREARAEENEHSLTSQGGPINIDHKAGPIPHVQRTIELRPPGSGSALPRAGLLIERLNKQSPAIQYRLEGNVLRCDVRDEGALTYFDQHMRTFISQATVIPMLLVGSSDFTTIDQFNDGTVDLDDLLATDDLSLQSHLLHVLTERSLVPNYNSRISITDQSNPMYLRDPHNPDFELGHNAGLEAQAEHLRNVLGDPTIRLARQPTEQRTSNDFIFQSNEGYQVILRLFRVGRPVAHSTMFVQTESGELMTVEALRARRTVAAGVHTGND